PLAGAFYGFELILGTYSIRALAPVMVASLSGVLTERFLVDPDPTFAVGQVFHFEPALYLLFALMGAFAAGISVVAMLAVNWAEKGFRALPLPKFLRPALGGALLSAIALSVPQVLGSGHGAIQFQFDHNGTLLVLMVLLVAKLVASAISIGSGFRGGLFSSALFLGCLFGAVFADVLASIVPQLEPHHTAMMLVGMGSVAAGIIGAPLTMVFLVLEGTGDFPMTAGVMIGVVVTSTIVRRFFGYSFSTWRFHLRGLKISSPHDIGWLQDLTVEKLMRGDAATLLASTTLAEARQAFPLGSTKKIFVIDAADQYVGMLDSSLLHDPTADPGLSVGALVVAGDVFLLPQENIKAALNRFDAGRIEALPVVRSTADRTIIGYLTEAYALRRYTQMLETRRSAELGQSDLYSSGNAG
ncbi:MAG: chloride channel protein, partial [Rhizomicrobium sp.]